MHSNWFRHTIFFTLLIVITSSTVIIFGHALNFIVTLHQLLPPYTILFSFIVGIITYHLYKKHQTVITAELAKLYTPKHQAQIPMLHIPLIIITTLLSHLFGASVGREGVAVQIGGTYGGFFSRKRKQWDIHVPARVIITTGMATGFGALFGMPLTAALFTIEVSKLYKKTALKWLCLPFIGSLVASQFSLRFGLSHLHFQLPPIVWSQSLFWGLLFLLGLVLVASTLYLFIHHTLSATLKYMLPNHMIRIILGSLFISTILFGFKLDRLHGLGNVLIQQSFVQPDTIPPLLPFLKILFTLSFLALGFKGGEVTPIFSIGAMLGAIVAMTVSLPAPLFAIIGLAAFFSATTKTYIAPLFLALEITSPIVLPFLIPIIIVLYFTTPKIGIYQVANLSEKNKKHSH